MSSRSVYKLILGVLLSTLIFAAVISVSVLSNERVALPLYLGIAAVGALFVRLVLAPGSKKTG